MDGVVKNAGRQEFITDWYIPEIDPASGWAYPGPVAIASDPALIMIAHSLAEACSERDSVEFVVNAEDRTYRGHRIDSVNGRIFSLRKMPSFVPAFHKLGLDPGIQKIMMSPRFSTGGLVLISGETGQGKSTTSASFLKARMERFGSFCLTLENPPELPLHGFHGEGPTRGICVQTDVKAGEFGEALRGAVRCYPTQGNSILFVGEVRDPETAGEALRIAINGHLVVTSIHGGDIISSLKRFMALALSYQGMSETEGRSVLASAFRLIVHQKLRESSQPGSSKRLDGQLLFSPHQMSPVANRLKEGKVDGLSTDIQQQERLIQNKQTDRLLSLWDAPN
jgi:Tfp pilus assembly pilus retraction ATPase PilT